nr:hypothetical protein [Tanacetum cinerariifolium]
MLLPLMLRSMSQKFMFLQAAMTRQNDEKTKREAKGKSPIELSIGVKDLSDDFEEFFDNSTNGVNAANLMENLYLWILLNDDPYMPALEDITYSDNKEDVVVEADFSNLETNITFSPILTTRVHKDHHVTQIIGHTQEEGIDYEEVFAPIARIEAIRLFLAYASFMGLWYIKWMSKVLFFIEPLKKKCMFVNLHDLKTLIILIRGKIDQTLFIKKLKGDILLVQVYVDDIIFGSTNKDLCKAFEKLMKDKF